MQKARGNDQYREDNRDFMFTILHNINDKLISSRLQDYLPNAMTEAEKASNTSKCWRHGGCTLAIHHPDVQHEKARALSGLLKSSSHYITYVNYYQQQQ